MNIQKKIEDLFSRIFSEKAIKMFEKYILYLASIGFVIHLIVILLNNYNIIELSIIGPDLFSNPISALYTPFSFILIYEAFLLIYYIPRSFTTAVGKQYQIMSLIVIRKIFKDIPLVDLNANWIENADNQQLIFDLVGVLIIFFLIYLFKITKERLPIKPVSEKLDRFIASKKLVSIVLLPILFSICIVSFVNWYNGVFIEESFNENLNNLFFNEFFTILILADVFILLLSFQYTERYSQLIRNTGFIISTILLRLSFSVSGLTSILLIISGIVFGLLILLIYNAIEKEKKLT
ncbi:hypothetical protein OAC93_01735 [Flavobacteriaceae bacterium]|jgi:hypothetical protein|nr:hypothetical protein [Flavobacteriaceae bacterium]MDA9242156.1 hypothetical protein [Flavobacteriaceae bacterium]MDB4086867.1 hypothetical protein [Flavobacteriaceae bacterium]MDB4239712.1 hypothetical protein [Flavobacteriaceae bacterium]MDB9901852.1 hypothetical protein [Flavobacteriaceae bacterium]